MNQPWRGRRIVTDNLAKEYHIHKIIDREPSLQVQVALERATWLISGEEIYFLPREQDLTLLTPILGQLSRDIFRQIEVKRFTVFTLTYSGLKQVKEFYESATA